ncbi:MAG: C1 family peptidase [Bacteroidales bacterium]
MKLKHIITLLVVAISLNGYAQNGGITKEMLQQIKKEYKGTPSDKAIQNAITHNDIKKLAKNFSDEANRDFHFSNKVISKGITNQDRSGRCWLFSGLNVLRAKTIANFDLGKFQFSQNYTFFWDQLEKSNLFLQGIIDTKNLKITNRKVDWLFSNPLSDGGQFTGISDNLVKYGCVPSEVMPETYSSNNTSNMSRLIGLKLKEYGLELRTMTADNKKLENRKTEMLGSIYRFLVLNLGVPPTEFTWTRYNSKDEAISTKKYTPMSFFKEYVGTDLQHNYVMLMNDPSREYNKAYEIEYDRHLYDGNNWIYINLTIEKIKEMAIKSIKDSTMMYFSCDVGKFLDRDYGVLDVNYYDYGSLMGTTFGMNKKQRILTHASGSSHAMTLMAVDLDQNGNAKKWMVENSWGMSGYKGHLIMTDEWFNEYMFRLVVEKKYVPTEILDILKGEVTMLPPWDPMFLPEEN